MNYQRDFKVIAASLLELEALFHSFYHIESPLPKDRSTSIRRYQVLKLLEQNKSMNLTELCERFNIRKNTCSELLDRMIKDSLVDRTPSQEDRRKIFFSVAKKGKEVIGEFEELLLKSISGLFKEIPDEETSEFVKALETVIAMAKKLKKHP